LLERGIQWWYDRAQSIAGVHHMKCVVKKDEAGRELHLVYGEVYAPNRPDSDGDFMTVEQIMKMAHDFLRKRRTDMIDLQHNNEVIPGASVVESFIAREGDPDFIEGAWVVGVHIPDDDIWEKVKKGEINGFSMEAMAVREDKVVEIEIPPVVTGLTSKNEDHVHRFYVAYDEEGRFLGGMTDEVDGHKHAIVSGTITEEVNGHRHLFSAVDNIEIVG
jgi:hypothetical protein